MQVSSDVYLNMQGAKPLDYPLNVQAALAA